MAVTDQEVGRGLMLTGELEEGATTITDGVTLPSGKTVDNTKSWAATASKGDTVIIASGQDMTFAPAATTNQRIAGVIADNPNIPGGADPFTSDEASPATNRTATIECYALFSRYVTLDAAGGSTLAASVEPSDTVAQAWKAVAANDESYVLVAGAASGTTLVLFGFGGNFA